MAKKPAKGILTKAPAKKKSNKNKVKVPKEKYKGLNKTENRLINQTVAQDDQLATTANSQLDNVKANLSEQVRWNKLPAMPGRVSYEGLPTAPVSGDFNNWRQQQIDTAANDFNSRFADQFKQDDQDFQTMMYERGIPIGSALYNRMQGQHERQQNDAKLANLRAGQESAGQNASQFFNIGTTARGNAIGERQSQYSSDMGYRNDALGQMMAERNQPLADFNALQAAQSGMSKQAYLNQQQNVSAGQQAAIAAANNATAAQIAAANNAAAMQRQQAANDPNNYQGTGMSYAQLVAQSEQQQSNANKSPSYGAQLGAGLLGGLTQGIGYGLFK